MVHETKMLARPPVLVWHHPQLLPSKSSLIWSMFAFQWDYISRIYALNETQHKFVTQLLYVNISVLLIDGGFTAHSRVPSFPPSPDTPHDHSHPSTFHIHSRKGRAEKADWLSTKKYLSVLSFFLSKVEPHPPQPQTKQVFYINPIATPRFQNTTSKVRFPSFIYPSSLPAHSSLSTLRALNITKH